MPVPSPLARLAAHFATLQQRLHDGTASALQNHPDPSFQQLGASLRPTDEVGDGSGVYMEPPAIYSDSVGMPPEWHMQQRNPHLHDQMFPRPQAEGTTWGYDQTKEYERWKEEQLLQQLRLRMDLMKRAGGSL